MRNHPRNSHPASAARQDSIALAGVFAQPGGDAAQSWKGRRRRQGEPPATDRQACLRRRADVGKVGCGNDRSLDRLIGRSRHEIVGSQRNPRRSCIRKKLRCIFNGDETASATTLLGIHPTVYPREVLAGDCSNGGNADFVDHGLSWGQMVFGHARIFAIIAIYCQDSFAKNAIQIFAICAIIAP